MKTDVVSIRRSYFHFKGKCVKNLGDISSLNNITFGQVSLCMYFLKKRK